MMLTSCYDVSKMGYFNISILMLFIPRESLFVALSGWSLAIAVMTGYIIIAGALEFVEDD